MHRTAGKVLLAAGVGVFIAEFIAGYQGAKATDANSTAPGPGGNPVALWFADSIGKFDPVPGINFPLSYTLLALGAAVYFLGGYVEGEK